MVLPDKIEINCSGVTRVGVCKATTKIILALFIQRWNI